MAQSARDSNKRGWEMSDFPIVCETCLGPNPYLRMTKCDFDKECKICTRPFSIFRWQPGPRARHKKTEICQTCAKMKNVCQTCLLDLQYGLPVQVRDHFIQEGAGDVPMSAVSLEYMAQQNDRQVADGLVRWHHKRADEAIKRLARTTPYYKRNLAHICSFFLKGECKRGDECPYRHELPPEESELSHQNFHDRYYGTNDPVAKKMLGRAGAATKPAAPDDKTVTTLYVGGIIDERVTEADLRDKFYAYGEIVEIRLSYKSHCAFVTFSTREATEEAVNGLYDSLLIKGLRLRVAWGRPAEPGQDGSFGPAGGAAPGEAEAQFALPPPPGMAYAAPVGAALPGVGHYPSQDPRRMGSSRR